MGNRLTYIDLLLRLLEAPTLVVTRSTLQHYQDVLGKELLRLGLLVPAGFDTAVIASDEDDAPSYRVEFDDYHGQLGYHSLVRGWVRIEQAELERYHIDVETMVSMFFGNEIRTPIKGLFEIDSGFVWELGQLRLLKTSLTQVWFVRRLWNRDVQDKLKAATDRHTPTGKRLVLTSTPHERLSRSFYLEGSAIVPLADVLDRYAAMRVDVAQLAARFQDRAVEIAEWPLYLSRDNSTLTILGDVVIFGGMNQRNAIRRILDAHHRGAGVNAATTLQEAGFGTSIRTFSQAFKKQWPQLKAYLKPRDKLWRFEL